MLNTEQFSIIKIIVLGLQILSPYTTYLADLFLILCIFLFGFALYKRESRLAEIAPTLLTGLSLFGSFLIAFIGISVFDPNAFENSLPNLLSHLGIALFIGLVGLFLALIIRTINNRITQTQSSDVTPTVIYLVLKEISTHNVALKSLLSNMTEQLQTFQTQLEEIIKLQKKGFGQQVRSLEEIKQNLIQEGENSLVTSLQMETKKGFQKLITEFRTVADKVATENVQVSINAMNHLQASGFIESIEKSRYALQAIATQTTAIPKTMQQFGQLMQGLNQQLNNMASYLESFQQLREQAGDAFPVIEKNLNDLTQGMQQVLQRNLELLETTLETQLDMAEVSLETQLEGFEVLQNHFAALINQVPNSRNKENRLMTEMPTVHSTDMPVATTPEMNEISRYEIIEESENSEEFVSIEDSKNSEEFVSDEEYKMSETSDNSPEPEFVSDEQYKMSEDSDHSPKIFSNETDEMSEKSDNREILSKNLPERISENRLGTTIEESDIEERISENLPERMIPEEHQLPKTLTDTTAPLGQFNRNEFEVLQDKAYTFMELGRYEEAISYFQQALALKPDEFSLFYNEACCYAILEQVKPAMIILEQAMALNAECLEMAQTDSDFDAIRSAPEFQSLLYEKES
ncbi:membrane protein [Beggiatoa sp. PS]|nr:membrane protein [Beggiatoa sp. PS]